MLTGARNGYTLVEVMVTLAIFAMLLAMGVPSMRGFLENGRIRAAGEAWKYGLTLARNEAVRLNVQVEFVADDTGWQVRRVADGTVLHRGTGREGPADLTITMDPEDSDRVTFDAFGRTVTTNPSDGTMPLVQVDIASARPPDTLNYQPLRLQLLAGGLTRLCNPAAEADDPRACL